MSAPVLLPAFAAALVAVGPEPRAAERRYRLFLRFKAAGRVHTAASTSEVAR